jgi:hypothetical protein
VQESIDVGVPVATAVGDAFPEDAIAKASGERRPN